MNRSWFYEALFRGQGQGSSVAANLNMCAEPVRLTAGCKKSINFKQPFNLV